MCTRPTEQSASSYKHYTWFPSTDRSSLPAYPRGPRQSTTFIEQLDASTYLYGRSPSMTTGNTTQSRLHRISLWYFSNDHHRSLGSLQYYYNITVAYHPDFNGLVNYFLFTTESSCLRTWRHTLRGSTQALPARS